MVTQNSVGALCGSCTRRLAILNNQYSTWGDESFSEDLTDLCFKAPSGAYCAAQLMQFEQAGVELGDASDSQASSEAICSKPDVLYCWRAAMAVEAARTVTAARNYLVSCAGWYGNKTMETNLYCAPSFRSSLQSARALNLAASLLCTKNRAGKYCIPMGSDLLSTSCVRTAMGNGTCSAECRKNVSASIGDLGCCAGTVQEALVKEHSTSSISNSDVPYIPGYAYYYGSSDSGWPPYSAPGTDAPVVLGPGEEPMWTVRDGGLYKLVACSVENLNQTLRKRCIMPMFEQIKSSILVRMVFSELEQDYARQARVVEALKIDVALAARVPLDSVNSNGIYPSREVMVNTSTTSRRQGTMSEGCRWEFDIIAPSTAEAVAAVANVQSAGSLGRLPLKNTKAALQQLCPTTCVGVDGVNSIELTQASSESSVLGLALLTLVSALLLLF
jgi:hypothetical protein